MQGLKIVLAAGLVVTASALAFVGSAQAASGTWDRAWGEDVDSMAPGLSFEVCVAATNCKTGVVSGPALAGDLSSPLGIATDAAGNVYVADTLHDRVQKFNALGAFERAWGEDVASPPGSMGTGFEVCVAGVDLCKTGERTGAALGGDLNEPVGVATDVAGNVYVADNSHNRVQKFSSSGVFQRAWGEDVASAGPGNTGTGFEICVAANGDTCKTGEVTGAALGGELNGPRGIATDAAGNVYVSDSHHDRVQKFSSSGIFERAWGEDVVSTGPGNTGNFEVCVAANGDACKTGEGGFANPGRGGELDFPDGLATDMAGNVYVGDSSHSRVQKFNSLGVFERAWGEDVVLTGPSNGGGNFEICVAANGDTCQSGVQTPPALGGELSAPSGVATDTAGKVYVADFGHHRVQRFSASGAFERAWGEDVASAGPGNTGTGFEVCAAAGEVCKTGETTAPALGGEFNFPNGLATDAGGNLYVADTGHHRIQKFADPVVTPPPGGGGGASPQPTGQRAAALKKCKKIKKKRARKRCRAKAKKKPL